MTRFRAAWLIFTLSPSKWWQLACIINCAASVWILQYPPPPYPQRSSAHPACKQLGLAQMSTECTWQGCGGRKRLKQGMKLYSAVSDCSQPWEMVFRNSTSSPSTVMDPVRQTLTNCAKMCHVSGSLLQTSGIGDVLINMDFYDNFFHLLSICTVSNSFSQMSRQREWIAKSGSVVFRQHTTLYFDNSIAN